MSKKINLKISKIKSSVDLNYQVQYLKTLLEVRKDFNKASSGRLNDEMFDIYLESIIKKLDKKNDLKMDNLL